MFDSFPPKVECSWASFCERFGKHIHAPSKTSVAAFSPAEWKKGQPRKKSEVLKIHFAAVDLDEVPEKLVEQIRTKISAYSHLFYTTWSHAEKYEKSSEDKKWCFRVVMPLDKPVQPREFDLFWRGLHTFFFNQLDLKTKDAGRIFFVPSIGEESPRNIVYHQEKETLRTEEILKLAKSDNRPVTLLIKSASVKPNYQGFLDKISANPRGKIGKLIKTGLSDKPLAKSGDRDDALFKLSCYLTEKLKGLTAQEYAAPFQGSIDAMGAEDSSAPTFEDFIEKIERRLTESPAGEEAYELTPELQGRIYNAFAGKRSTPYTKEELKGFAKQFGITITELKNRWIIQFEGQYFILLNGKYSKPISRNELKNVALVDLAPAISAGVDVFKLNKYGDPTIKSEYELVKEYGFVAHEMISDLCLKNSHFDWVSRIYYEAVCPERTLKAEYSREVQEYFELLGGQYSEKLLDWISVVTQLDEPCAALFLHGVPGAGKTLLADGLARLWTTREPTELSETLGNFNESITRCPLILADEKLSTTFRQEGSTADLRSFIQARKRTLKRKFKPSTTLQGAIRLIITSNNKTLLNSRETLTKEDIQAIQDRILYVFAGPRARDYLNSLSLDTKLRLVRGDAIAKHALWLKENREIKRGERFLVAGCDSSFHQTMATSTLLTSAICNWLTAYLQDPDIINRNNHWLVRIKDGQLLTTSRALSQYWDSYQTHVLPQRTSEIASALATLAPDRYTLRDDSGKKITFRGVNTDTLLAWNEEHGYADRDEILDALKDRNPKRGTTIGAEALA